MLDDLNPIFTLVQVKAQVTPALPARTQEIPKP